MDIDVIDTNDPIPMQNMKKTEAGYKILLLGVIRKSKENTPIIQSEAERFITRYVPVFLKHFRGSLIKATRSKTFETTATILTMMIGNSK